MSVEVTVETVKHSISPSGECIPHILVTSASSSSSSSSSYPSSQQDNNAFEREFLAEDMSRVLDFDNIPEPPTDCTMLHCEGHGLDELSPRGGGGGGGGGDDMGVGAFKRRTPPAPSSVTASTSNNLKFPSRHVALRGSYIFVFDSNDIKGNNGSDSGGGGGDGEGGAGGGNVSSESGKMTEYEGPPVNVVCLDRIVVEFPPGGRRVFREHAHTDARNGYELAIRHVPPSSSKTNDDDYDDDDNHEDDTKKSTQRRTEYLVADSLGQRDLWAAALRVRAEASHRRDTKLRPGGAGSGAAIAARNAGGLRVSTATLAAMRSGVAAAAAAAAGNTKPNDPSSSSTAPPPPSRGALGSIGENDIADASSSDLHASSSSMSRFDAMSSLSKTNNANNKGRKQASLGIGQGQRLVAGVATTASSLGVAGDEQADVDAALSQFGAPRFDEHDWVDDFFANQEEVDAPRICNQLERWQSSMKKGLRGAVLEQYEYFVEASREMTTMGREVSILRSLVDRQADLVRTMKNIDFAPAFSDDFQQDDDDSPDDIGGVGAATMEGNTNDADDADLVMDGVSVASSESSTDDEDDAPGSNKTDDDDDDDDASAWSSTEKRGGGDRRSRRAHKGVPPITGGGGGDDPLIEVPDWLGDVSEEIQASVNQCRYSDGTELALKAKAEIAEILNQHEKLTEKRLSKKQLSSLQQIQQTVDRLAEKTGDRLAEGLRRKNEALKHAAKRERSDPKSVLAPSVSPICLNDDSNSLHLLVKLGRHQDAATAYSARRSLLLMETLHERPISVGGTSGTMDVVIYAAQLSQSFFTCLSMSVEGFLDLFLESPSTPGSPAMNGGVVGGVGGKDGLGMIPGGVSSVAEFDGDNSSLHSAVGRKVPSNALSSIVLWCDTELSKFSAAFGGTRVLGKLALSPPTASSSSSSSRRIGASDSARNLASSISKQHRESAVDQRNRLRAAEEMGDYATAAKLRQKIAEREQQQKEEEEQQQKQQQKQREEETKRKSGGRSSGLERDRSLKGLDNKERQAAIEVAAKCIEQAFQFASDNLDSIGLPLTPRLAEYLRIRLKGCEAEIAVLLVGWEHLTFDWAVVSNSGLVDGHSSESSLRRSNKSRSGAASVSSHDPR